MKRSAIIGIWFVLLGTLLLSSTVCAADPVPGGTTLANESEVSTLPPRGKVVSDTAPPKAVVGMIWVDSTCNIEYIFDGSSWIPHTVTDQPAQ
ncbi:hypothetical protein GMST_43960 [Geomonas silvestris]|uniref:Lipoprotein n=1 Tax=Geomonas silvestris TaxID=2740184 RepID=A0A6V8MPZ5_9BACT|nr:hypothetical protein [Geomonas silvestris]GFO62071.1 hypothetical protein GMST_43960 [Geomonas silvestris]